MTFIQDVSASREHKAFSGADSTIDVIHTVAARDELSAILEPATELVIWERSLPAHFCAWLEKLAPSQLPKLRVLVCPTNLRRVMEQHLDACGMATGDMRGLLISDIEGLILTYASITESSLVDVRLERISHNACWRFHRDVVEARLLTTYRGLTTEWVQPKNAERALSEQERFDGPIEKLAPNEVAIFKGSSAGSGRGIVHRSPPIEGTGCTRLLLCLNEQSGTSPDP